VSSGESDCFLAHPPMKTAKSAASAIHDLIFMIIPAFLLLKIETHYLNSAIFLARDLMFVNWKRA